jgi:3-oxoacyl-[acyl-carrier protein] reductase
MRVENKVCLVTGGARGIGRNCVEMLAKEGAKMVISADMGDGDLQMDNVRHVKLNVTDRDAIAALMADVDKEFGCLDVLVNNAGITQDAFTAKMTEAQWDNCINVNLKGVFNVTQAALPLMKKSECGASIITMSSVVGIYGNIAQANYAATKGGVITMSMTWAKEFARDRIRSNVVSPGFIRTPMTHDLPEKVIQYMESKTPLGCMGDPDDIAYAVLYLSSQESKFVTGQNLPVTGGLVI